MSQGFERLFHPLGASLRLRLMLGAASVAVLFMLALRGSFSITLEQSIQQRLAADASALIAAARVEDGGNPPDALAEIRQTASDGSRNLINNILIYICLI